MFRWIDRSLRPACHELFCVFEDFYASGTRDVEVTKSLQFCVEGKEYIDSDISVSCVRFKIQGLYYLHILSKLNDFRRLSYVLL